MSRTQTRRKCRCCSKFFIPDPRTQDRQRYCSNPACRKVSKTTSQRRWLSKNGNGDHFRGAAEVRRVQSWRKEHPGYWKKNKASWQDTHPIAGQSSNPAQSSRNVRRAWPGTLQEDCITQHPAFIGLISMVTGSTLQDDIDRTARQLLAKGRDILGLVTPGKINKTIIEL